MSMDPTLHELGDRLERSIAAELHADAAARERRPILRSPVMLGIAATGLAAIGVATALVIGSGPGSPAGGPRAGGPAGSALTGPVKTLDAAYIVKRVKAKVAGEGDSATVSYGLSYAGGDLSSNGSLVNLGWKMSDGYTYVAPDGAEYTRATNYFRDGAPAYTSIDRIAPDGHDTRTIINEFTHTYYRARMPGVVSPEQRVASNTAPSTPSGVRLALHSGQMAQRGTSTIDGTPTIVLSFRAAARWVDILYVDAHTYRPLRSVDLGPKYLGVVDWMPATAANIATVKDDSMPAGYTKASSYQNAFAR